MPAPAGPAPPCLAAAPWAKSQGHRLLPGCLARPGLPVRGREVEGWAPPSALCWSTFRSLQAPCRPRAPRSSEVTPKCSQSPPYSPRGPPELEVWNGDLKATPPPFTKILPLSSLPVVKQAETSLHCVGGEGPTPGFMALGKSESPLDRWPQEGHSSCLTFDSLGLPHPHLP